MLHLVDTHRLVELAPLHGEEPDRGLFLSSLFFLAGELHPHIKRYWYPFRYALREADVGPMWDHARLAAFERLKVVEKRTDASKGPYYLGKRFSLLDLVLTYFVMGLDGYEELLSDTCPLVLTCMRLVQGRPKLTARFEAMYSEGEEMRKSMADSDDDS